MTNEPVLQINHLQKFGHFEALKILPSTFTPARSLALSGQTVPVSQPPSGLRSHPGNRRKCHNLRTRRLVEQRRDSSPLGLRSWRRLPLAQSTGGEIIDLLLKMNGTQHSARTDELIKQFGLDPTKKARTYSKGNRQKVALIAAFSQDADFYIFDEPTSGLDPLNERQFQMAVLNLKQQGKAVLLSSHILSEVERMCDRSPSFARARSLEREVLLRCVPDADRHQRYVDDAV